ncbi:uncharacterized protein C12orf29 homolog [Hydractinia symbiolongicarpus]|uniref:uncharacterized protein C12orf29 homolog n=1 Tax=Hydractinia symbiolongicarpus TaxID=13093 RepID=UPI00254F95DC|nr:uncharacterized protein C12orf29 homolog [Hydractinia symbiolongicarpus]XP_057290469.1 uncharacterized protein C12orf29 homolog [Hydractinia symbiolongicarpus]
MTDLSNCCSIKGKIKCIFKPKILQSSSNKRKGQSFKVTASEELNEGVEEYIKNGTSRLTMKLDGTCCMIREFNGRPWLWARHDVKPNKSTDKKFKSYLHNKNEHDIKGEEETYPAFEWNIETDFKEFPDNWISASGVDKENLVPDDIGHLVGWVPVDPSLRTHLWHLSVVDLTLGKALFLFDSDVDDGQIQMSIQDLKNHFNQTFELIGTNVNGNPYGLGNKKEPFHVLVRHGEIPVKSFPPLENGWNHELLREWFLTDEQMEGVVWHCTDGKMFKLHRHHLDLPWPVKNVFTSTRKVVIDTSQYENNGPYQNKLFTKLKSLSGKTLENISTIFNEESQCDNT